MSLITIKNLIRRGQYDTAASLLKDSYEINGSVDPLACRMLGYMYYHGLGISQSFRKSAFFFYLSCGNGDNIGCYNLGYLFYKGQGVKSDWQFAKELFKRACNDNIGEGCLKLGQLLSSKDPKKIMKCDSEQAAEYFKKATHFARSEEYCFIIG